MNIRFGDLPQAIVEAVNQLDDAARLETQLEKAVLIASLTDFEQVLANAAPEEANKANPTPNTAAD